MQMRDPIWPPLAAILTNFDALSWSRYTTYQQQTWYLGYLDNSAFYFKIWEQNSINIQKYANYMNFAAH